MTSASVNGVTTNVANDSTNNYGAPTAITTGSLMNTLTYAAFLGLTSDTGPNQAVTSTAYDSYARPTSTTSPFGATTTYAYALNPATVTATTNHHWTRQTLDGFGRTIKTEAGDNVSTQSVSESVYGPCACSPLGKLMQQSIPHAPGATSVAWTTYTYDGVGRTLSVTTGASDTTGTSSYAYAFSMYDQWITAWDPSGNYKYFVTDAFNNLIAVSENAGGTYYSYDLLDHLITVSMQRSNGTQTRTFAYTGNFLTSATNPENGTVTYSYDPIYTNKVSVKTDAKGQQIKYTYDAQARLIQVQRFPSANNEDLCQQENYYYDNNNTFDSPSYSNNAIGRLAAVQYYGGSNTYGGGRGLFCDTTFTEMYTYSPAGAKMGKRLRVTRTLAKGDPRDPNHWTYAPYNADLNSTYTYDMEGRMLTVQYPSYSQLSQPQQGPNLGYAYDTMGRLNMITDLIANASIISGATYGPAGELLTMTGSVTETRTYNSMKQLTGLTSQGWQTLVNMSYAYPATGNNGKIASQTDNTTGGEQVVYLYDAMNRLLSATAGSWAQTYSYDGFGNLTEQKGTGTAPSYQVYYNLNNRNGNDYADANGNITNYMTNTLSYDVENRLANLGSQNVQYSYAAGNKRVWRGVWTNGALNTDEVTFWGVTGQKLTTYQLSIVGGLINHMNTTPQLIATQTATNYYFGGRLILDTNYYVASDRLGSIGKFYPWGQEKSVTYNGTEKFTGYFRDADTGLDYAVNRYHSPGTGRFLSPDPYMAQSGGANDPANPSSWNRHAYVVGDPINLKDPTGRFGCLAEGFGDCAGCDPFDPEDDCCDPESNDCGGGGGDPQPTPKPPPQPTCSITLYERSAGGTPGNHTYLLISDPGLGINDILEGGPTHKQKSRNRFGGDWGNLFGWISSSVGANRGSPLNGDNTAANDKVASETGGAATCAEVDLLLSDVEQYDTSAFGSVRYRPVPTKGSGTYNSNSFTYTLLYLIGLQFPEPGGWNPGWGLLVPGLSNP